MKKLKEIPKWVFIYCGVSWFLVWLEYQAIGGASGEFLSGLAGVPYTIAFLILTFPTSVVFEILKEISKNIFAPEYYVNGIPNFNWSALQSVETLFSILGL